MMADEERMPTVLKSASPLSPYPSEAALTPEYFLAHYLDFLILYIANGRPSADTLNTYRISINQFIRWCAENSRPPLSMTDYQIRLYLQYLYGKQYKEDTIAIKLISVRAFFSAARKLGLIKENPCADVKISTSFAAGEMVHFFSLDQMSEICGVFRSEPEPFLRLRNTLIVYLMGVEGLRNIEVQRLNREDVDWSVGAVLVRGKGRDRYVYPCAATFEVMDKYLECCPAEIKKGGGILTPLILSASNRNANGRISRDGIRFIMDRALTVCGLKVKGISCHVFRHSCGTNLYAAEKDLRLVQEVLGHRDPKTTARYAHLQERISRRSTEKLVPPALSRSHGEAAQSDT